MPTDRYTKTVLTIIAGALVAILVQNGVKTSQAQQPVQKVAICDSTDPSKCVDFVTWTVSQGVSHIGLYVVNVPYTPQSKR